MVEVKDKHVFVIRCEELKKHFIDNIFGVVNLSLCDCRAKYASDNAWPVTDARGLIGCFNTGQMTTMWAANKTQYAQARAT